MPHQPSLVAQMVGNLPANAGDLGSSLGQEDPLEKEMATHSDIFPWRFPWTEKPRGLQSLELQRGTTGQITLSLSTTLVDSGPLLLS